VQADEKGPMKEALRGLTLRGRAFLAGGVTALVCAVVLGQHGLIRIAALLLALPLVTAFGISRSRHRLSAARVVSSPTVPAGQVVHIRLRLTNEGLVPTGRLLVEDVLPFALGSRPRFVLPGLAGGSARSQTLTYQVRPDLRGRYELGPLTVEVSDPFGLVRLTRTLQGTTSLTVTPRVVPLPSAALGGALDNSGESRPRSFAAGRAEDVTVREYRRGDDLRRVHWRSSARIGELMVRREEQPWQARATIVLDNRAAAHRGAGVASSFETAVTAAASVATHLSQRGFTLRLVTSGGDMAPVWHTPGTAGTGILETLAVIGTTTATHLDAEPGDVDADTGAGVLVAVLGSIADPDLIALRRLRHQAGSALALVLDVDEWQPGGEGLGPAESLPLLVSQGWQAAAVVPQGGVGSTDAAVTAAWHELGVSRASARSVS
jgi:uncharacterized protein (DUF58 family)